MTKDFDRKSIPLNRLAVWSGNVRKTGADKDLDDLMASIEAHGLLQPLHVFEKGKTTNVVAGQRRLLALQRLADAKKIGKDYPVPCIIVDMADALEISLAENTIRADMHPADQYEAWAALEDKDMSLADIAARFGVKPDTVRQRLKLGRVAPMLMDLYREGRMNLEQLEAFTLTDEQDAQVIVWNRLTKESAFRSGPSARTIREALTTDELPATHKLVRLVGLEAYEAAGGAVRRDLFDDANAGYVQDKALLEKLAEEKLQSVIDEVKAEGWKWVEFRDDFSIYRERGMTQERGKKAPLTEAQKETLKDIVAEIEPLEEIEDDYESEGLTDEQEQRLEQLRDRRDELSATALTFPKALYKRAGAIVTFGYNDKIEIERGLVLKADMPKPKPGSKEEAAAAEKPSLSQGLVDDLHGFVKDAVQAELADDPAAALVAVIHALLADKLHLYGWSSLNLDGKDQRVPKGAKGRPYIAVLEESELEGLPGKAAELWGWLASLSTDRLLRILAVLAAPLVTHRTEGTTQLREALGVNVRRWYTPGAETYFGRVSKDQILADLADMGHASAEIRPLESLKKGELAKAAAAIAVHYPAWLPQPMRPEPLDEDALAEAIDPMEDDEDEFPDDMEDFDEAA